MKPQLVWILVALAGCDFSSAETQTIENSCANAADCSVGTCEGGICIDDSGVSVEVAIEVLRSPTDVERVAPASWAFAAGTVSASTVRDLDLPATRELRGTVRWEGARVPATLRFVRRMQADVAAIAPVVVEVETLRELATEDGELSHDFSALLVAGETYDLVVLPSNDMVVSPAADSAPAIRSLPPIYLELPVDDDATDEPMRVDIVFPSNLSIACTEDRSSSCTLEAQVLSVGAEVALAEAETGLQVRAIDQSSGRVVSSIGETDELGRFAIRIGETASKYLIRVTSSVGREPFPSVSVDPDVAFADDPAEKRIFIPRLPSVQFTGRVRDSDDRAVAGATVRFSSAGIFGGTQLGLEGSFSGSATTDAEGRFGAVLLPGFYAITVTPPEDIENTWGVLRAEALVGGEITATEALIVPNQVYFRGWVATFHDEPAAGVTIVARARSGADLGSLNRSQEVVSNELGAFAMSVDAGLYDVHLKVPSESGFAWQVEPALSMDSDESNLQRAYRLDPPLPLRGVVRSSNGDVVPNARVRAHVLRTAEGGSVRPIQVAETISGEDGSYRLLITPRLGDE